MEAPFDLSDLIAAEGCLAARDVEAAQAMLERMVEAAEAFIAQECETTDDVQFFSFSSAFDRLAYRRVENDPRRLVQVPVPLDRLYADVAFAYIERGDWEGAKAALSQAVRWNPMNCAYRLDLAELYRMGGDVREWAALSFSVLERASECRHLATAFANLGNLYLSEGSLAVAVGCAQASKRFGEAPALDEFERRLGEQGADAARIEPAEAAAALAAEGLPEGANAEIAVCLLMCASDAARAGERDEATRLAVRAHDLVGEEAAMALMKLINDSDAELAAEKHEVHEDA